MSAGEAGTLLPAFGDAFVFLGVLFFAGERNGEALARFGDLLGDFSGCPSASRFKYLILIFVIPCRE